MSYYTIITTIGQAKMANAQVLGRKLDLTYVAIGDGMGIPTESQTELQSEVWRGQISTLDIDTNNDNWIVIESVIPSDVGGFTVREVGIFDVDGDLIAVGNYPETYKPQLAEGSAKDLFLRMIIEVSNAESVELKIDPTIAIPSRAWVEQQILAITPESIGAETPVGAQAKVDALAGEGNTKTVKEIDEDLAAHLAEKVTDGVHGMGSIASRDYEEGIWTPNIAGSTTSGINTYSVQVGRYILKGREVTAWFNVTISTKDAQMSGVVSISGLPFVSANDVEIAYSGIISSYANVGLVSPKTQLLIRVTRNSNNAQLLQGGNDTSVLSIDSAGIKNSTRIEGCLIYRI